MRVTDNMRFEAALASRTAANDRVYSASQQASSGLRVAAPSDDPASYATAVRLDGRISSLNARASDASRAAGDLAIAESTLAAAGDVMVRAREIATWMSSDTVDAATRASAASEVDQLRQTLLGLANTRGGQGYLFGGTKTSAPPFDAAGTFLGNNSTQGVEIADGVVIAGNASGAQAFTASAGGRDVLGDLDALATALRTNNVGVIHASIDTTEAGRRQIVDVRSASGVTLDRLQSASDIAKATLDKLKESKASEVEAEPVSAYTELLTAQSAYDRNLSVTKLLISLSAQQQG
jgi:flagellar hook-associated protein 3 FlgL